MNFSKRESTIALQTSCTMLQAVDMPNQNRWEMVRYSTLVPSLHNAMATLFSTTTVSRILLSCFTLVHSSLHKCQYVALLTRKFLFHSRSSHAEMTCMNAWLLFRIQTDRRCTELLKSRSVARAVTVALNSASWLVQKAAVRILLAKILLLLLIRIHCRCLSHTIDKRLKQRKNAIIAVATNVIACSLSVICLYTSPRF